MPTSKELMEMKNMDIQTMASTSLVDIGSIKVDNALPARQRIMTFLNQVGNPYCFLCGETKVQIEFAPSAKPLEEKITDYFIGLKNR